MKEDLKTIVDCFSGADGGISFVKLKVFLEVIEDNTSPEAMKIKALIRDLAELISTIHKEL